jgi:hypothetical protein
MPNPTTATMKFIGGGLNINGKKVWSKYIENKRGGTVEEENQQLKS